MVSMGILALPAGLRPLVGSLARLVNRCGARVWCRPWRLKKSELPS
jgi:hypothetical protein